MPRTSELYIHRSGRTARAKESGVSLLLIGEKERDAYKKILFTLGRDTEIPDFPVNGNYFQAVRARVTLARRIDKMTHSHNQAASQEGWLRKMAEEADLDFDDDLERGMEKKRAKKEEKSELGVLQGQLKQMLAKPLFPKVNLRCYFSFLDFAFVFDLT